MAWKKAWKKPIGIECIDWISKKKQQRIEIYQSRDKEQKARSKWAKKKNKKIQLQGLHHWRSSVSPKQCPYALVVPLVLDVFPINGTVTATPEMLPCKIHPPQGLPTQLQVHSPLHSIDWTAWLGFLASIRSDLQILWNQCPVGRSHHTYVMWYVEMDSVSFGLCPKSWRAQRITISSYAGPSLHSWFCLRMKWYWPGTVMWNPWHAMYHKNRLMKMAGPLK